MKLLTPTALQPLSRFNLPGIGGVYNAMNLNVYGYAAANPHRYVDPTGERIVGVLAGGGGTTPGIGKEGQALKGALGTIVAFDTKSWEIIVARQYEVGVGVTQGNKGTAGLFVNAILGGEETEFSDLTGKSTNLSGSVAPQGSRVGITGAISIPDTAINWDAKAGEGAINEQKIFLEAGISPATLPGYEFGVTRGTTIEDHRITILREVKEWFRDTFNGE